MEEKNVIDKNWKVDFLQDEDKPGLLQLSALHYREKDLAREEFIDWLTSSGPVGPAFITVAKENTSGEVIGFTFNVPFHVKIGDDYGNCRMGGNAVVHPDFRNRGVFSSLRRLLYENMGDNLFTYGFPKPRAVAVHMSGGSVPVSQIPLLVRPLHIEELAKKRFTNPLFAMAVKAGWVIAKNTISRSRKLSSAQSSIRICEEDFFDESFDHFWERVANKYEIIVKRDTAFLTWRFSKPAFRSYQILAARVNDELVGYTVLRCTEIDGIQTGLLMDLLVESSTRGEEAGLLLVKESTQRFEEAQMELTGCLMLPHTHEYRILRQAGYVETPVRFSPQRFMFTVRSFSPRASNEYLTKTDRWFISMANHDAV